MWLKTLPGWELPAPSLISAKLLNVRLTAEQKKNELPKGVAGHVKRSRDFTRVSGQQAF